MASTANAFTVGDYVVYPKHGVGRVIELQSEDHTSTVQSWKLTNTRPIKYTGPTLSGTATDVAIEELVLAAERIELE